VTTFFDIKRAFDTVWHAKLLDKLSSIGISGRLYQFVQAFLADRRISVRVGASLSDEHILDMGVPQGSVIAPTLFSVMLHDIEAKRYPSVNCVGSVAGGPGKDIGMGELEGGVRGIGVGPADAAVSVSKLPGVGWQQGLGTE
ncbi:hypothetical protein BaRGS_00030650, partial [Batillaria attramentaria]